jgi:hypothetical protein
MASIDPNWLSVEPAMMAPRRLVVFLLIFGGPLLGGQLFEYVPKASAETTAEILAAQIRSQGITCDNPKRAVRDAKRSKPDYEVWVLTCENATYRVSRYPDLAAKVEKLH